MYTTYPRDSRKSNIAGKEDKAGQNTEHMNQTSLCGQPHFTVLPEKQNNSLLKCGILSNSSLSCTLERLRKLLKEVNTRPQP